MANSLFIKTENIIMKEKSDLKPEEITLEYLIFDLNVIKDIEPHDFDLSLYTLDLSELSFKIDKK